MPIKDRELSHFRGDPIQRFHSADVQFYFLIAIVAILAAIVGFEAYGCYGQGWCSSLHDEKDVFEPFVYALLTAFGGAAGFFFASKRDPD